MVLRFKIDLYRNVSFLMLSANSEIHFCFLGVMKLEATKFRPREVVKHVLQTAAASLQKILTLEGHIADDVPIEVRF